MTTKIEPDQTPRFMLIVLPKNCPFRRVTGTNMQTQKSNHQCGHVETLGFTCPTNESFPVICPLKTNPQELIDASK